MNHFHLWQALFSSFYSKKLYQDVEQHWKGIGLTYLLLTCSICAIFQISHSIESYFKTWMIFLVASFLVTLLYAGIAKLFVKCHHSYKALCRLSAIALTPALFLLTFIMNVFPTLYGRNIICLILSLAYLVYAIEANRESTKN
jgi:hypothetical protein